MNFESRVNILLVDDQPKNLVALEAVLDSPQYRLVKAGSGEEALKALLGDDFAVILLDVMMPGMNGFETASLIRRRDRSRYTPIVFVTAVGKDDIHVERGYSAGAVDYLFKPIVPEILRAKISAFVELFRKTEEIKRQEQQLRLLERREHDARLAEAEQRHEANELRGEMDLAREIQQHLFPREAPRVAGFDIAGASFPAGAAGGDYFDFLRTSPETLDVAIGDVAGHGVGPALLMAATRAYLRAFAPRGASPEEVLAAVNRPLTVDIAGGPQFVTLLLMRLRLETGAMTYASAGHNTAFHIDARGHVKAELPSTSMPLGLFPEAEFEPALGLRLESGDLVLMYTDGLVEADSGEAHFGVRRVLDVVRSGRHLPAEALIQALHGAVTEFLGSAPPLDDITAIVVKAE